MQKLGPDEYVVAAFAEHASGPGWANSPVVMIVYDRSTGKLRQEGLQPEEQTAEMHTLYDVSAAAHGAMTAAVRRHLEHRQ